MANNPQTPPVRAELTTRLWGMQTAHPVRGSAARHPFRYCWGLDHLSGSHLQ
jgi:hypothetical protein